MTPVRDDIIKQINHLARHNWNCSANVRKELNAAVLSYSVVVNIDVFARTNYVAVLTRQPQ